VAPLLPPHLAAEAPDWLLTKSARVVFAKYQHAQVSRREWLSEHAWPVIRETVNKDAELCMEEFPRIKEDPPGRHPRAQGTGWQNASGVTRRSSEAPS